MSHMELRKEIEKRRTFGIISHPDAGKTTLTEKLLLFGGAIRSAGAVKAKKTGKYVTSDFMEIEKQRGISVSTSVMGFSFEGIQINILDTPGHKDFSEDTYRTLTAVDSCIMVIDCVKGVEEQTQKLMEVCRMRNIPIITFINKCDREGQSSLSLLDDIESKLQIYVSPVSCPIGLGRSFAGVYSMLSHSMILFKPHGVINENDTIYIDLQDKQLDELLPRHADQLREEVELLSIYRTFSWDEYREGLTTPVLFGSALNNFGVRELLQFFMHYAPPPQPRETTEGFVNPDTTDFSGFVFKIHANLDLKHRSRVAFLRVCSGAFDRGKYYYHVRSDKKLRFNAPTAFMAQEKEIIERAYPGDIVGLPDTDIFQIGDTLTESKQTFKFKGIPDFSPELFKSVVNLDPMKAKQLNRGLEHLCEEGLAQLFVHYEDGKKIVAVVGELQFEVISYRLEKEYGAYCRFDRLPYVRACWLKEVVKGDLALFLSKKKFNIAQDKRGYYVYLAETPWSLDREIQQWKGLKFCYNSELLS